MKHYHTIVTRAFALITSLVMLYSCQTEPVATPVIGISGISSKGDDIDINNYVSAISQAGGIPMIIPITTDEKLLSEMIRRIDGIILTNGGPVSPKWYDENNEQIEGLDLKRDTFDILLAKKAKTAELPILAINRGALILNVAMGGTLYQNIEKELGNHVKHYDSQNTSSLTHPITVFKNNWMSSILTPESMTVNTHHKQGINNLSARFICVGQSEDGLCELFCSTDELCIGTQFDPETSLSGNDKSIQKIFDHFIKMSRFVADMYK